MKKPAKAVLKDYDSPWKQIIEELFEPFLEFFFPLLYADVDFSRGYEVKSKELYKLLKEQEIGKRYTDELIKVYLKDGTECWLLIHIEVQSYHESDFARRMFVYYYRIFDKYNHETVSLVILTDPDESYKPDTYLQQGWGFKLEMQYPLIKIVSYKNRKTGLENSTNPMAILVLAHLESLEFAYTPDEKKYDIKLNLVRMLYKKGYAKKQVGELFNFIDWVISLPEYLEEKIMDETVKLEEVDKMTYVTNAERIGEKRGEERGEKRATLRVAENLLNMGFSIKDIAKATGLIVEEVKELKTKLKQQSDR